MITIGLITVQIVIENILIGYFKGDDDLDIRELQPLRDETNKNRALNDAGWCKLIEYCGSCELQKALPYYKLMKFYKENPSLKIFIEEIERRNIIIDEDGF